MARKAVNMNDDNVDAQIEANAAAERARREAGDSAGTEPGSEVAPVDRGAPFVPATTEAQIAEGKVIDRAGDMGLARYLEKDDYDDDAARDASYKSIIEQIFAAESMEEVLTPPEAISARDMVATPLIVESFDVNTSEYDVGSPYYASMKVKRADTGEALVVNTGNQRIMAQLIRLQQLESFPFECYIRQSKRPNRHGSFPLSLDSRQPEQWK